MPPRRDLQQGDDTARQLFGGVNKFPTFGSLAQAAQGLQNAVPSAASLAATGINALRNSGLSVQNFNPFPFLASLNPLAGTPLVQASRMQRGEVQQPVARAATLPSGAIMTGGSSDIYPTQRTTPSFPIAFDVTKTQTPFSQFSASTPQQITRTAPQQMQVPTQAPIFPTKPQEPRIDTAVREGTISATPQQLANFNARDTAFEGRTPEQQQALLAQVRASGARLAAQQTETMRNFAESRGARFASMPAPQGRFGQPLTGLFPQSTEAIAQRTERDVPFSATAGFGFGRMQQEAQNQVQFGMGRSPLYRGMGISAAITGGPQPSSPMMADNATEEQRRRIFSTI
jgi:hypothetical protein